jgi:hypothetical protein
MKEAPMSPCITDHWLAFIADSPDDSPAQITAIPASTRREHLGRAPRVVLAAANAYHDAYPDHSVVFLASVTRWLGVRHDLSWSELRVDLDEALGDLQRCASTVRLDASPIAVVIVATGGAALDSSLGRHASPVRNAIEAAIECHGSMPQR